jgi:hypothetical protein
LRKSRPELSDVLSEDQEEEAEEEKEDAENNYQDILQDKNCPFYCNLVEILVVKHN